MRVYLAYIACMESQSVNLAIRKMTLDEFMGIYRTVTVNETVGTTTTRKNTGNSWN